MSGVRNQAFLVHTSKSGTGWGLTKSRTGTLQMLVE